MKVAFFDLEGWETPIVEEAFRGKKTEVFKAENQLLQKSMLPEIKEENILAMDTDSLPPAEAFKKALESFFLQRFKNVVLTPHNAFNSHEAVRRIIDTALLDMATFADKGDCEHRVDKK